MKIGSRGGRQWLLRYAIGTFVVILLVVLLSHTFEPTKFLRESYDHDVGASGDESTPSSERVSDITSLDTSSSGLNDASIAPSSEELHTTSDLKGTSATVSDGVKPNKVPNAIPDSQILVTPKPQLDVVIAHHSEEPYYIKVWTDSLRSIPYMQELGMRIIIYTKGSMELAAIKEASGADEVIQLPNVGREGGTYLHHLLSVYDDPPQFTLFAQAKLKKAQEEGSGQMTQWLQDRLRADFGNETGFMSMDRKHDICYCGHCTDMGRDDFYPLWPQIYSILQGDVCQRLQGHVLSFNGHFIVSRKRVLARPREIYQYLQALVDASADHWIHSEPEPTWFEKDRGKSIPSNPKFGHTLERLWHTIFRCDDPAMVVDCDVKGMEAEGPGGCSCRDAP
ncbi:hypothetical protein HO173_011256 [Letharia columbiana]|uniref:Uncharacterized protein n=1 Tax=Letharia columbiana TaxID=112416 RepID=A0A8H6FJP6_9LECA|nr:uncharacterized protein HO173_011256 [Letharia columbiana]KAF6229826.1 hypothetical protein HO173_011256 [Letharia columbiana]